MSVDRTDYVVVGVKLPEKYNINYFYDNYEDHEVDQLHNVGIDEVGIISDSMMGRYTVAAILIAPPGDIYTGIEFTEIPLESVDLQAKAQKVIDFCKETLDLDVQPSLLAFTDWS